MGAWIDARQQRSKMNKILLAASQHHHHYLVTQYSSSFLPRHHHSCRHFFRFSLSPLLRGLVAVSVHRAPAHRWSMKSYSSYVQ
jgi:hypothetical protein